MDTGSFFIALVVLWLCLWFVVLLPARMAQARRRSAVVWVLVSLLATPVLAILMLLVLGDAGWRRPADRTAGR